MELDALLRRAAAHLADAGVPSPRADAELLAGHVLDLGRGAVQAQALSGVAVQEPELSTIETLVQERATRVPLQHLTGIAPFRTLELKVGPGVFIPRPETETVVGLVLEHLKEITDRGVVHPRIVDLGTGSGAIAAAVAAEFPAAEVHAVEVSGDAAAWAQLNFEHLPPGSSEVTLHHCDLRDFPGILAPSVRMPYQGIADAARQVRPEALGIENGFDVVVSNPPYIPPQMVPTEQEVHEHDPQIALYGGGPDGLELPRAVIAAAKEILVPGGWFIIEHAEVQAETLRQLCHSDPSLVESATHQDLSGRDRATSARLCATAQMSDMTTVSPAA